MKKEFTADIHRWYSGRGMRQNQQIQKQKRERSMVVHKYSFKGTAVTASWESTVAK